MAQYITVQQALDMINEGDEIVTGLGCAEAHAILSEIHTIAPRIQQPVEITNCLPMSDFKFQDGEYSDKFFVNGWFYSPTIRKIHKNGNASYIPNHLHSAGTRRLEHKVPRFYIGSCSAVDEHGYISLSMSNTYEKQMIDKVEVVILETNPNFPRTFGDVQIHVDDIQYLIEADYPVPIIESVDPNEKDEIIGKLIADLIKDGDCIQLGIGGIPNAVARALYDKKDLGVHTEMLTSEMAKLAKAGVITGAKKQKQKGKMVTTFVMGDQELYDFVDNNPIVEVLNGAYVNNPFVISQNDNQVSINTAIEIDLSGQVASESIGHIQYSGTGGQADTARGAVLSKGGRSIIALYSTASIRNRETGERELKSKIVSQLTPGAIVSLQRQDTDYVVTEFGVANLRGCSVAERVERLIAIAHPDFRDELLADARAYGIVA